MQKCEFVTVRDGGTDISQKYRHARAADYRRDQVIESQNMQGENAAVASMSSTGAELAIMLWRPKT